MATVNLPTHTLTTPLDSTDEQILRQALANYHQIANIIERAKAVGMDVSQHEARAAQHHGFITRSLEQFFPTTLQPPPQSDEDLP